MSTISTSSSSPSDPEDPNPNPKISLIDHSLDVIENQLASIALNRDIEPDSSSNSSKSHDDVYQDAPTGPPPYDDVAPLIRQTSGGSSGGERMSSGGSTSGINEMDGGDEICEVGTKGSDSQADWVPGKRHVNEV